MSVAIPILSGMGLSRYWVGPGGPIPQYLEVHGEIDHHLVEALEGHTVFIGPRGQLELERQSITEKNNMINHSPYNWQVDVEEWGGIPSEERYGATLDRVRPQTVRLGLMAYF